MKDKSIDRFLGTSAMTIVEAMEKIDKNARGILFVVDENLKLLGSLTDGDIRRWLIKTGDLRALITEAMNDNPYKIQENELSIAKKFMSDRSIFAVPVVDVRDVVIDIVFAYEQVHAYKTRESRFSVNVPVVMMAGGKGTRLYPYTKILPKPLIPVGDLPIAEHIINSFFEYGCTDFYLIVNHKKNMLKAYFSEVDKNYNIYYADEEEPLGTGGGLSLLKGQIEDTFIFTNCDTLIETDFSGIYKYHKEQKNLITMICSLKNYQIPYGVINMGNGGQIESMEEKPMLSFFTNTGCYIVEPEVINDIPENTYMGFPSMIERYKAEGKKVGVYPISEQAWLDMGEMDALENMRKHLEKRR